VNIRDTAYMNIDILNGKGAAEALASAERKDQYNKKCHESISNYTARSNTIYKPAQLNETDMKSYTQLFKEYMTHLPVRLLREIKSVNITILMPSADTGFPHTRPDNMICFPQSAILPSLQTFNHEFWHLHQRAHPAFWNTIFMQYWDFTPYDIAQIPDHLRSQIRLNPDTLQSNLYCWKDEWVPLPIFQSPAQQKLGDCSVWFWNARTRLWKTTMPATWAEYFHSPIIPPSAHEHPNELSAYMLSQIPEDTRGPPGFLKLARAVGAIAFSNP